MELCCLSRILAHFRLSPPSRRATTSVRKSDWAPAIRIWAQAETDRKTAHQEAGIICTRYGIKQPGLFTVRDWLLSARKSEGLVRTYKSRRSENHSPGRLAEIAAQPKFVPETQRPLRGTRFVRNISEKPVVFVMINPKGGTRRSYTAGLIWNALIEAGFPEPVVRTDERDHTLSALIGRTPILEMLNQPPRAEEADFWEMSWDQQRKHREKEEEKELKRFCNILPSHLFEPRDGLSIPSYLVDLPSGIDHEEINALILDDCGIYRDCFRFVGIVPTTADPASKYMVADYLGKILASESLDGWIHVSYGTAGSGFAEKWDMDLNHLRPVAVITPPELTDHQAASLQNLPPLSSLSNMSRNGLLEDPLYSSALDYWTTILPEFAEALHAVYSQAECLRP